MKIPSHAVDEGHEYLRTFILGTVTGVALVMLFQKINVEPIAGDLAPSPVVLKASPMLSQNSVGLAVSQGSEESKASSMPSVPVLNVPMLPTPLGNAKGVDFSKILTQVQQKNAPADSDAKPNRNEQDDGAGVHVVLRAANQDKPKAQATPKLPEVEKKPVPAISEEPAIGLTSAEVDKSYKIIQARQDSVLVRYGNRVSNIPVGGKLPDGRKLQSVDENTGELVAQ